MVALVASAASLYSSSAVSGQEKSQDTSTESTNEEPKGTPTQSAETHVVTVGAPLGQHAFDPPTLNASTGDYVSFRFWPSNHSVVKMDPNAPCQPYESSVIGGSGWWSGFIPVAQKLDPAPSYNIKLNNSDPIYFYCSAPGSCMKYGMVGAINPENQSKYDAVAAACKLANFSISPGEPIPNEAGQPVEGSPSPILPSATSSWSGDNDSNGSSLSGGAIAGIVIGSVAAFALIGLLFFLVGRKKSDHIRDVAAISPNPAYDPRTDVSHPYGSPPMYQDSSGRYSVVPPTSSQGACYYGDSIMSKPIHTSMNGGLAADSDMPEGNRNRLSELPTQNYGPVEMYTPDLTQQSTNHCHESLSPSSRVSSRSHDRH